MVLFLGIFFGIFGIYLFEKAATSKNPTVIFYCGVSAMLSFTASVISIALFLT
jgi:hypothetical protein